MNIDGPLRHSARILAGAWPEAGAKPSFLEADSPFTRWVAIVVLGVALVPAIAGSLMSITNPFMHPVIAFATLYLGESYAPLDSWPIAVTPGSPAFIMAVSQVTGLAPKIIQYLPLVGPILILALYVLANRLFRNRLVAACATAAMALMLLEGYYGVWRHSFGLMGLLLLAFVYILVLDRGFSRSLVVLAIVIYGGSSFFSYSVEPSFIALSLGLALYLWLLRMRARSRQFLSLSLLFLVVYIAFNNTWLHEVRRLFSFGVGYEVSKAVLEFVHTRLAVLPWFSSQQQYEFVAQVGTPAAFTWLQITYMLMIIIPMAAFAAAFLGSFVFTRLKRFGSSRNQGWTVLWWALLVMGLSEILVYLLAGAVATRFFLFWGPMVTLLALRYLIHRPRFLVLYSVLLVLITGGMYTLSWNVKEVYYPLSLDRQAAVQASAQWFVETIPEERWSLDWDYVSRTSPLGGLDGIFYEHGPFVDHQLGGMFMVKAAELGKPFVQQIFDPHLYENLVTAQRWNLLNFWGTKKERETDVYAVINANRFGSTAIRAGYWTDLTPMAAYLPILRENWNFNKIYDDDVVWIVRSRD